MCLTKKNSLISTENMLDETTIYFNRAVADCFFIRILSSLVGSMNNNTKSMRLISLYILNTEEEKYFKHFIAYELVTKSKKKI